MNVAAQPVLRGDLAREQLARARRGRRPRRAAVGSNVISYWPWPISVLIDSTGMPLATNVRHSVAEQLLVAVDAVDDVVGLRPVPRLEVPVPLRAGRLVGLRRRRRTRTRPPPTACSPAALARSHLGAQDVARRYLDAALRRPPQVAEHERRRGRGARRGAASPRSGTQAVSAQPFCSPISGKPSFTFCSLS